jgi:hypothetical protein
MGDPADQVARWYASQCDGDWEHSFGITIETLDNPGWSLRVDLRRTELEDRSLAREESIEPMTTGWLGWIENGRYRAACGPLNLAEALAAFLAWMR